MITLPTNHPYFFTCPSCGCKLISVSTGNRAKPHCPKCDYSADDAFVVKDRVTSEAMNVIADNTELAENFAETVKHEIETDDDTYAHIGFHLANDIRNQSPACEFETVPECGRITLTDHINGHNDVTNWYTIEIPDNT